MKTSINHNVVWFHPQNTEEEILLIQLAHAVRDSKGIIQNNIEVILKPSKRGTIEAISISEWDKD